MKKLLMVGAAFAMLASTAAVAQADPRDPDGYYSATDHDGYYSRDGRYHRFDNRDNEREGDRYNDRDDDEDYAPPPPPPDRGYYREGQYEDNCRRGNNAAGTIFGAIAGGLIGGAASHGNGGAVVGGAILGGLLGNTVSRDIPCEDHPYAFRAYATGLNGDLHRRYEWRHGDNYGYFVPDREFYRGRTVCRSWTETTYVQGRSYTRSGTACRQNDGNWRFD